MQIIPLRLSSIAVSRVLPERGNERRKASLGKELGGIKSVECFRFV
jgi:hypothetical protein